MNNLNFEKNLHKSSGHVHNFFLGPNGNIIGCSHWPPSQGKEVLFSDQFSILINIPFDLLKPGVIDYKCTPVAKKSAQISWRPV